MVEEVGRPGNKLAVGISKAAGEPERFGGQLNYNLSMRTIYSYFYCDYTQQFCC